MSREDSHGEGCRPRVCFRERSRLSQPSSAAVLAINVCGATFSAAAEKRIGFLLLTLGLVLY